MHLHALKSIEGERGAFAIIALKLTVVPYDTSGCWYHKGLLFTVLSYLSEPFC